MALRVLNPNAEVLNKSTALHMNINTVKGLQDVLKTNLGPKGTIKLLVGGTDDIKLTKDGNTLLKEMVNIDFETEPTGTSKDGKKIFFRDIWLTTEEIADVVQSSVLPAMFKSTYEAITGGNPMWNELSVPSSTLYTWDSSSTYIHEPPYFKSMTMCPPGPYAVKDAYCLLNFGDSITMDHISPAGMIQKDSLATKYLMERGVDRKDFNSYGSRRGNDEVMARGTFANIRLMNKLLKGEVGPKTIHILSGDKLSVFDAMLQTFFYLSPT